MKRESEHREVERDEKLWREAITAADGDLRAFEQLVQQYHKRILADCRHMTQDPTSAEDLAQEIFVKAFFGLRAFEGRSSFRHWLQRIKVHHCLNFLKKQEGKMQVQIDEDSSVYFEHLKVAPTAHGDFESMDNRRLITRVLDSLPSTLRVPLIMRDMDDLSYEEIANALGLGLSAAKMRIKRAREEFRRRYEAVTTVSKPEARSRR
jgi:RNA polymerase sigma-70 factor (ECF subfamily)